jgi:hypothetical protein
MSTATKERGVRTSDSQDDNIILANLIREIHGILTEAVSAPTLLFPPLFKTDDRFLKLLRQSWIEVRRRLRSTEQRFRRNDLTDDELDLLRDEGLAGVQLRVKEHGFMLLRKGVMESPLKGVLPWFRLLLRSADDILESIGKAIPGLGAVIEFKLLVERVFEAGDLAREQS